jgi:hypothetical protein
VTFGGNALGSHAYVYPLALAGEKGGGSAACGGYS